MLPRSLAANIGDNPRGRFDFDQPLDGRLNAIGRNGFGRED
jgi:hypothetical protein